MDIKYIAAVQKLESLGYCWRHDEWNQTVSYGCHCDLDYDKKPDSCVMDSGRINDCLYAYRLDKEGKDKTSCNYWRAIDYA